MLELKRELPQYRMHESAEEGVIGRRVYRAQRAARALACIVALAVFLVGVVTATGGPGDPGKGGTVGVVLGVVTGALVSLLSLWLGAVLATNSLTVTSAGLIHRSNLRRMLIDWPDVESFTVGPERGRMGYPTLIVYLRDGSKVVTRVTSFTAGYPSLVARELTALQAVLRLRQRRTRTRLLANPISSARMRQVR